MGDNIFAKVKELKNQVESETISSADELEKFRIKYLGSKNIIRPMFGFIRKVASDRKKEFGLKINAVKKIAEVKFNEAKETIGESRENTIEKPDLSIPPSDINLGSRHPLMSTMNQMIDIFAKIGFSVEEEREIENDWYNFSAMNTPDDHPARDMQDTYYLVDAPKMLLRTHTSSVQSRVMTTQKPPIRIIAPGRVYRNETISARAHCQFHQVEGLYINKNVSFADLKQTLIHFAKEMFGKDTEIRLRPSYFPFTEPSAEMDISCFVCDSEGCNVCKYTGWVEILGCGMVDPQVLINCGIDPNEYSGFAFGMGVERITMLKYKVNDIRLFFENDTRFIKQFQSTI